MRGGVEPSSRASFRNCKKGLKKFLAFTLAETLIVMGIIGIVSALTLPNLNSSTGEKEKVAKLKKIYQNLDDAYGRATAVYGPISEWGLEDDSYGEKDNCNVFWGRMLEFMKVSKTASSYTVYTEIILADGSSVWIYNTPSSNADSSSHYPGVDWYGSIQVDIDGPNKGKNKFGYDKFAFSITNQGILPESTSTRLGDEPAEKFDDEYYATAWVIMNENLDYLKCFDDLNWDTKTSCK